MAAVSRVPMVRLGVQMAASFIPLSLIFSTTVVCGSDWVSADAGVNATADVVGSFFDGGRPLSPLLLLPMRPPIPRLAVFGVLLDNIAEAVAASPEAPGHCAVS